jgi:hypothetical protein
MAIALGIESVIFITVTALFGESVMAVLDA